MHKSLITLILLSLVVGLLPLSSAVLAQDDTQNYDCVINPGNVLTINVRSQPDVGSDSIYALPAFLPVTKVDTVGDWDEVITPLGETGYIRSDISRPCQDPPQDCQKIIPLGSGNVWVLTQNAPQIDWDIIKSIIGILYTEAQSQRQHPLIVNFDGGYISTTIASRSLGEYYWDGCQIEQTTRRNQVLMVINTQATDDFYMQIAREYSVGYLGIDLPWSVEIALYNVDSNYTCEGYDLDPEDLALCQSVFELFPEYSHKGPPKSESVCHIANMGYVNQHIFSVNESITLDTKQQLALLDVSYQLSQFMPEPNNQRPLYFLFVDSPDEAREIIPSFGDNDFFVVDSLFYDNCEFKSPGLDSPVDLGYQLIDLGVFALDNGQEAIQEVQAVAFATAYNHQINDSSSDHYTQNPLVWGQLGNPEVITIAQGFYQGRCSQVFGHEANQDICFQIFENIWHGN